ncbi:MAG: HD-GYP domain-containing protein [Pirellulaceae bacterium]
MVLVVLACPLTVSVPDTICLSIQSGPLTLATTAVSIAVEALSLTNEIANCRAALAEAELTTIGRRIDSPHRSPGLDTANREFTLGLLRAMSSTIDARDNYTQGHSERVAQLSFELAQRLGLSLAACHEIYLAGMLHDIGKIGIPDSVLLKEGKLSNEEYRVIQQHPEIGYRIIERLGSLQFALPGILHHHERWDGKGYPHGLQGPTTPMMARILAVADSFDAMTSSRIYRQAMSIERAVSIMIDGAGSQWDADVVNCLQHWLKDRTRAEQTPRKSLESLLPRYSSAQSNHLALMTVSQ